MTKREVVRDIRGEIIAVGEHQDVVVILRHERRQLVGVRGVAAKNRNVDVQAGGHRGSVEEGYHRHSRSGRRVVVELGEDQRQLRVGTKDERALWCGAGGGQAGDLREVRHPGRRVNRNCGVVLGDDQQLLASDDAAIRRWVEVHAVGTDHANDGGDGKPHLALEVAEPHEFAGVGDVELVALKLQSSE